MPSKPTLVIHGASAFTATELLSYLDNHPQGELFEFILAGRTRSKLEDKNAGLKNRREVLVVDVSKENDVKALVAKGDVVVNLAGPFRWYNAEAIIAECARTGKHYVDLTGEADWLGHDIVPKYNYLASKTGACIIPSCGFDSVPSDLVLYNALSTLQAHYPNESITRNLTMFRIKGTMSGGTIASMYSIADVPKERRMSSEWIQTPTEGPTAKPRLYYTLPSIPSISRLTSRIGAFFFMYPHNRTIVRRSWFLSRTIASQGEAADPFGDDNEERQQGDTVAAANVSVKNRKEPVHGGELVYEEALDVGGSRIFSALVSAALGLFFAVFMASKIVRSLLKKVFPAQGTASNQGALRNGKTLLHSIAQTTNPSVVIETTYKGEGDPGYWHTCHTLAESALSLVLSPPEGTALPPLGKRGGCLTPATGLGGVLVRRLRDSGKVSLDSRVVDLREEGRKTR